MRRLLLLAFIGVFVTKHVTSSILRGHPKHLEHLFGPTDNKTDPSTEAKEDSPNVCKTQECEKIGKLISEGMDKSVDPCDDFYEYACGNWAQHHPVPEGKISWSSIRMLQQKIADERQEILDAGPKDSDVLAVRLAKKWYSVCMDTDAMEKQGLEPIVYTLARIGGWPMIMDPDEWNEQEYSWQKVDDQYMRLTGRNAFHDLHVYEDWTENNTMRIYIAPPDLSQIGQGWVEDFNSDEDDDDPSDEDPSDENKESDERDSQEPGSEGSEENFDNDDDDDSSDYDDDDDDNDDVKDDRNVKKKIVIKKNRISRKKKLESKGKKKHDLRIFTKHSSQKMERIKRQASMVKVFNKFARSTHRGVLRARQKNKRNRINKEQKERKKETSSEQTKATTSAPQVTTEESEEIYVTVRKNYATYISKVARALAKARRTGVPEDHIDEDIEDLIDFLIKLDELTTEYGSEEMEMTLDDFQNWYDEKNPKTDHSKINWVYKITRLFDEASVPVDGDLEIELGSPDYFEGLISLLDKTPSRVIVNYIHWNFVSRVMKTTTKEMRDLYDRQRNTEYGDKEDRSTMCIEEPNMDQIIAYDYVQDHFSDDTALAAQDMIDDIQKEVEYQIKESDWMDEDTKDFVLAKLLNMKKYIGYPDWYRNDTIVKRYYQGLIICNSYYENVLSLSRYKKWKRLRSLIKQDDLDIWWMSPLTVNAFFSPFENSITLMAADFQSPFFAYDRPQAINYGMVGIIMGHEVNHGFDNNGRSYDKNGEFTDWLSAMADAYNRRAECFVEQYNNYVIDKAGTKIEHYGNKTAGENIADTMGLEASYRAYLRRERECGKPDTVLPGLEDVTHSQLFFLSFANVWCQSTNESEIVKKANFDFHSPGRLRVIGSVSNSEDFAKAFNCPVGSAMNPKKKCHVWK